MFHLRNCGLLSLMLIVPLQVWAGQRCNCSRVQSACNATVSIENRLMEIKSNSQECSRVDYLIEGQPFVALLVGGSEQAKWPGQPLSEPNILVERCLVCWDVSVNQDGDGQPLIGGASEASGSDSPERDPSPIIKVLPGYPPNAWVAELEGYVVVEFTVTGDGTVESSHVVESSDPIFDLAAIYAIDRYRYQPGLKNGEPAEYTGLQERFSFAMAEGSSEVIVSMD